MEKEHRRIISEKMKLAVHKRLHPETEDFNKAGNENVTEDVEVLDTNQSASYFTNQKSVQVLFF